jgi:hypothetical protein
LDESLQLYKNYRKLRSREYEEKYVSLIEKEIEEQFRQFEHHFTKMQLEMERVKNESLQELIAANTRSSEFQPHLANKVFELLLSTAFKKSFDLLFDD